MTKRWKILITAIVGVIIIVITSIVVYKQNEREMFGVDFPFGMIRFTSPMIYEDDSSYLYVFNEGNSHKYPMLMLLDTEVNDIATFERKDSAGTIYRIKPKYISDKYFVDLYEDEAINKPDYSDVSTVEQFPGRHINANVVNSRIIREGAIRNFGTFCSDKQMRHFYVRAFVRSLDKVKYIDSLPDEMTYPGSTPLDGLLLPFYFISFKTGNRDMIVPDEDIHKTLSYYDPEPYPVVIERNGENIQKQMIGKRLGEYEVWKDSSFSLDDYVMVFERYEDTCDYTWHLKHKDL